MHRRRNESARGSGKLLAGVALALASGILSLALVEIVLRGVGIDRLPVIWANEMGTGYVDSGDGIYRFDSALNMERMRPHYERGMFFNGYHWRHAGDWMGFRNPVDRHRVDIALIGDSMVYGHGLDESQTIRSDLERIAHRPVANLGEQSAAMDYEYEILKHDAARLNPPWVFIFFLNNDISDLESRLTETEMRRFLALPIEDHTTRYFDLKPPRHFSRSAGRLRNLYVVRSALMFKHLMQGRIAKLQEWRRRNPVAGAGAEIAVPADISGVKGTAAGGEMSDQPAWMSEPPFAGDNFKQLAMEFHLRAILKANDFANRRGMRLTYVFIAVPQPDDELFEPIIRDYCAANHIQFFSLRPALERARRAGIDIYLPGDGHFSAQGAAVTARTLADQFHLRQTAR